MNDELLFPVCTFGRVFDTLPLSEVLTLGELSAALRRFELKTQTMAKIERDIERIDAALDRLIEGKAPSGKFMGKLIKAAEKAEKSGKDPIDAAERLASTLREDARRSAKRDLRLWAPCLYRPGSDKRGKANVTHVSCLVLDYDDGTPIAAATDMWSTWFHSVHTTWSHTTDYPKFRVILPLAAPVPAEDWHRVWAWAEEHADFEIDPSMKSPAATYALPAVRSETWPREAFSRPGAVMSPSEEGVLDRKVYLDLVPKRPAGGHPSVIRGEDPDKIYIDHHDPNALYVIDEFWDEGDLPAEAPAVVEARSGPTVPDALATAPPSESASAHPPIALKTDAQSILLEIRDALRHQSERSPDLVVSLERLSELHARGRLSDDEFAGAKRAVIDGRNMNTDPKRVGPGRHRRTLCIDFDGVLHSYAHGWQGATTIVDPPVEGAIEWLVRAAEQFDVAIHSVRGTLPGGVAAMKAWLREHRLPERVLSRIQFSAAKPPAEIYIDDRAFRFEGRFPSLEELGALTPWTEKFRS